MNINVKYCKKCGRITGNNKHICPTSTWNKGIHICLGGGVKKGEHSSSKTEFKKGIIPWNKGIIYSKEIREKISKGVKGCKHSAKANAEKSLRMLGKKHFNWQGGKSFEPYTTDWTDDLKESIRKRDNYVCRECGIHQDELIRKLDIHHINYIKTDCNPNNLISLCESCHMKTNFNREYWIKYYAQ